MAKKLFCPKCGAEFSEGDLFCVECGNKIEPRKPQESVGSVADVELKDVEKVKLVANQNFFWHMIGVYLKDKQYLFNVKKKENWIEKINNAVNTVRNGKSEPTVKQNTDYIDEIKRLKELADAGVITKAEFEAKMKKLLGL